MFKIAVNGYSVKHFSIPYLYIEYKFSEFEYELGDMKTCYKALKAPQRERN